MTRQDKFLWMKDLLEHMERCHEQWETADERMEMLSGRIASSRHRRVSPDLRFAPHDHARRFAAASRDVGVTFSSVSAADQALTGLGVAMRHRIR